MSESALTLNQELTPGGVCVVTCQGVLDAHTASQLEEVIAGILKAGHSRIACDLAQVTYIASAGVGVFVGNLNTCKEKGGDLLLVHPQGFGGGDGTGLQKGFNVLEVFNLLGLADFIQVAPTREEAVRQLSG